MSYSILITLECILKKIKICSVFFLPDVTSKTFNEITEGWIATCNAPKMAVNIGDKFWAGDFQADSGVWKWTKELFNFLFQ